MKNARKFWILAIIFGLGAAFLAFQYTAAIKARYQPDDLVPVVKAVTDIPQDSLIASEQVRVEQVPAQFAHPGAVQNRNQVVGKVATSDIIAGELVLAGKVLTDKGRSERLSYSIPGGKRAISIPIDQVSGVSDLIKPGDKVDVIGTVDAPVGEQNITATVIFLQDIEVLAVGKMMTGVKSTVEGKGKEPIESRTLTLAVTPEQARPLVLVSEKGSIRLALRSPVDNGRIVLPPYELRSVIGR